MFILPQLSISDVRFSHARRRIVKRECEGGGAAGDARGFVV
jgi:hypothetical protein